MSDLAAEAIKPDEPVVASIAAETAEKKEDVPGAAKTVDGAAEVETKDDIKQENNGGAVKEESGDVKKEENQDAKERRPKKIDYPEGMLRITKRALVGESNVKFDPSSLPITDDPALIRAQVCSTDLAQSLSIANTSLKG